MLCILAPLAQWMRWWQIARLSGGVVAGVVVSVGRRVVSCFKRIFISLHHSPVLQFAPGTFSGNAVRG